MPLKVRCPQCRRMLVAEDEAVGQRKVCPACGRLFNVPLPESACPTPSVRQRRCPHCGAEIPPTAPFCLKCHRDVKTGKKLPLRRRLRLMSWRFWAVSVFVFALLGAGTFTGVRLYRIYSRPVTAGFTPVALKPIAAAELAEQLLSAKNAAERRGALARLSGSEARAAAAVAAALAASFAQSGRDPQTARDQIEAIDLLARNGEANAASVSSWLALLEQCRQEPALREAALRAAAMLGDARRLDELGPLWLDKLQRLLFLSRIVQVSRADKDPAARLVLDRARADLRRCADGLRHLARDEQNAVFEGLAAVYWDSWAWLGQSRGDGFAEGLFALARLDEGTLQFKPEDVRQPRDMLVRVSERGSPTARAAAGLVLSQCVPQYRSRAAAIAGVLGKLLPDCDALDQQRLTWAASRLQGKLFGPLAREHPLDVTAQEVAAALAWAQPGAAPATKGPYATPPALVYRAVSADRLLERDLLQQMRGGWTAAQIACDRWLAADLGCTPRLLELLHPGQRRPDYAALTTALIVVAHYPDAALRPRLELWSEATDQPQWVRALAYTVLGSLDAPSGRWPSGWPNGLNLGDTKLLEQHTPGWEHFGQAIAAGGPAMLQRLKDTKTAALSAEARTKLLEAAKQAAGRYALGAKR